MPKIIDNAADELLRFLNQDNSESKNKELWDLGLNLTLLYMGFSLLKGIFLFFTRQTIIVMSRNIEYDLKNEIFSKYQALNISFYKQNKTGDLMNRISEDVSKVRMYLGPAIMYTINVVVLFIMVITFMLHKNVELTLYVLIPLPLLSIIIYKVSSIINKKSETTQRKQSKITSFVQEAFSGIRVLKAYNRSAYFSDLYFQETEDYKRASLSLALTNALFLPSIILLIGISTILTIYIGGIKTISNELDYGDIVQFIFYINMLTWPFASVGWVSSLIQRAAASQKRINEFLTNENRIINDGEFKLDKIHKINFDIKEFTYPGENEFKIENIAFELSQGMTLGIFGKTGSGKSTIANLICRLYEIEHGQININNKKLEDLDLVNYREKIGYIPQDVFLFSDTIKNNIVFGLNKNEYTMTELEEVVKKAGIDKEIHKLTNGFDTKIGERGVTLSGGQKQRISIARALIRKPQFLIFDDCLSAVDSETSNMIHRSLTDNNEEQISIHISHRVSHLAHCDHIIVLNDGRIDEQGQHKKLLKQKGFYYQIFKKQQLEDNL
jgi:ATP-binding cassette, subfamily B, multidrug efflux pump